MIDIFVNSVYLYEDRAVLVLNCKDGTKTVMLAELEAAIESYNAEKARNANEYSSSHLGDNTPLSQKICRHCRQIF